MNDTKENILRVALDLFAERGYEAVSTSDIAGALGMTKAALYRHYKNKRDIFDSILARMEQLDAERANEFGMPDTPSGIGDSPATREALIAYSRAQFDYWTTDPFASRFRRMLTIEQFKNDEMNRLYQQYLVAGPLDYVTGILASCGATDPRVAAVAFYAPMFFLYTLFDGASDRDKPAVCSLLDSHFKETGKEK